MFPQEIVYISILTTVLGEGLYIKDTLRGTTKPNRASWFIWTVAPLTASFILFQNGGGLASLPVFMAGLMPLFVFLISFKNKNSYWKLNLLDYICMTLAILSLISWLYFKEGIMATIFAILADGIAFFPTYIKSWKAPSTETATTYLSSAFNAVLTLLVLSSFSFVTAGFALYLFFGNLVEIVIVLLRRRSFKNQNL